jgi:hypothetical protein
MSLIGRRRYQMEGTLEFRENPELTRDLKYFE